MLLTSHAVRAHGPGTGLKPAGLGLGLLEDTLVSLLKHLVDEDESLEGLYLVTEDGLYAEAGPDGLGGVVVPGVDDAFWGAVRIVWW